MVVDLLDSWFDFVRFDCMFIWDVFIEFDWWVNRCYCKVWFNCIVGVDMFDFCHVHIWCWWVFNCVIVIFGIFVMHFFITVYSFHTGKLKSEFTFSSVIFLTPFFISSNLQIPSQHSSLYPFSYSAHIQVPESVLFCNCH